MFWTFLSDVARWARFWGLMDSSSIVQLETNRLESRRSIPREDQEVSQLKSERSVKAKAVFLAYDRSFNASEDSAPSHVENN